MFQNVLGRLTKSKKGKSAPVITTEHNESDINNFTVDKQNDSEKKNKSILIPKSKNEKKDKKSKKKNEKKENKKSKKRKSKDSGPDQKENFSQSNESSSDGSNSISHSDAHAARSEQDGNKRGSKASSKDDDVRHSVGVAFDHQGNVKLLGKDGVTPVEISRKTVATANGGSTQKLLVRAEKTKSPQRDSKIANEMAENGAASVPNSPGDPQDSSTPIRHSGNPEESTGNDKHTEQKDGTGVTRRHSHMVKGSDDGKEKKKKRSKSVGDKHDNKTNQSKSEPHLPGKPEKEKKLGPLKRLKSFASRKGKSEENVNGDTVKKRRTPDVKVDEARHSVGIAFDHHGNLQFLSNEGVSPVELSRKVVPQEDGKSTQRIVVRAHRSDPDKRKSRNSSTLMEIQEEPLSAENGENMGVLPKKADKRKSESDLLRPVEPKGRTKERHSIANLPSVQDNTPSPGDNKGKKKKDKKDKDKKDKKGDKKEKKEKKDKKRKSATASAPDLGTQAKQSIGVAFDRHGNMQFLSDEGVAPVEISKNAIVRSNSTTDAMSSTNSNTAPTSTDAKPDPSPEPKGRSRSLQHSDSSMGRKPSSDRVASALVVRSMIFKDNDDPITGLQPDATLDDKVRKFFSTSDIDTYPPLNQHVPMYANSFEAVRSTPDDLHAHQPKQNGSSPSSSDTSGTSSDGPSKNSSEEKISKNKQSRDSLKWKRHRGPITINKVPKQDVVLMYYFKESQINARRKASVTTSKCGSLDTIGEKREPFFNYGLVESESSLSTTRSVRGDSPSVSNIDMSISIQEHDSEAENHATTTEDARKPAQEEKQESSNDATSEGLTDLRQDLLNLFDQYTKSEEYPVDTPMNESMQEDTSVDILKNKSTELQDVCAPVSLDTAVSTEEQPRETCINDDSPYGGLMPEQHLFELQNDESKQEAADPDVVCARVETCVQKSQAIIPEQENVPSKEPCTQDVEPDTLSQEQEKQDVMFDTAITIEDVSTKAHIDESVADDPVLSAEDIYTKATPASHEQKHDGSTSGEESDADSSHSLSSDNDAISTEDQHSIPRVYPETTDANDDHQNKMLNPGLSSSIDVTESVDDGHDAINPIEPEQEDVQSDGDKEHFQPFVNGSPDSKIVESGTTGISLAIQTVDNISLQKQERDQEPPLCEKSENEVPDEEKPDIEQAAESPVVRSAPAENTEESNEEPNEIVMTPSEPESQCITYNPSDDDKSPVETPKFEDTPSDSVETKPLETDDNDNIESDTPETDLETTQQSMTIQEKLHVDDPTDDPYSPEVRPTTPEFEEKTTEEQNEIVITPSEPQSQSTVYDTSEDDKPPVETPRIEDAPNDGTETKSLDGDDNDDLASDTPVATSETTQQPTEIPDEENVDEPVDSLVRPEARPETPEVEEKITEEPNEIVMTPPEPGSLSKPSEDDKSPVDSPRIEDSPSDSTQTKPLDAADSDDIESESPDSETTQQSTEIPDDVHVEESVNDLASPLLKPATPDDEEKTAEEPTEIMVTPSEPESQDTTCNPPEDDESPIESPITDNALPDDSERKPLGTVDNSDTESDTPVVVSPNEVETTERSKEVSDDEQMEDPADFVTGVARSSTPENEDKVNDESSEIAPPSQPEPEQQKIINIPPVEAIAAPLDVGVSEDDTSPVEVQVIDETDTSDSDDDSIEPSSPAADYPEADTISAEVEPMQQSAMEPGDVAYPGDSDDTHSSEENGIEDSGVVSFDSDLSSDKLDDQIPVLCDEPSECDDVIFEPDNSLIAQQMLLDPLTTIDELPEGDEPTCNDIDKDDTTPVMEQKEVALSDTQDEELICQQTVDLGMFKQPDTAADYNIPRVPETDSQESGPTEDIDVPQEVMKRESVDLDMAKPDTPTDDSLPQIPESDSLESDPPADNDTPEEAVKKPWPVSTKVVAAAAVVGVASVATGFLMFI